MLAYQSKIIYNLQMEKACDNCGISYNARHSNRPYCSRRCSGLACARRRGQRPSVEKQCEQCGKLFLSLDCRHRRFCSKTCGYAGRGKGGPPRSERIKRLCKVCGNTYETRPHLHLHTCSKQCWQIGTQYISKRCRECHRSFKSFVGNKSAFCTKECYSAWQAKHVRGARHPSWKGGTSKHYRRGYDWKEAAEDARRRDNYTCKRCGLHQSELGGNRRRLDVHHIIPWSVSCSNALSNLLSVCRTCHCAIEPNATTVASMKRKMRAGH